jgi:hypothetical protein
MTPDPSDPERCRLLEKVARLEKEADRLRRLADSYAAVLADVAVEHKATVRARDEYARLVCLLTVALGWRVP